MKIASTLLLFLIATNLFSQEPTKRKAIYSKCLKSEDSENCFYTFLQNQILKTYDQKAIDIIKSYSHRDTIIINSSIAIESNGIVDVQNSGISSPDKYIDKLNLNIIKNLDSFQNFTDTNETSLSDLLSVKTFFVIESNTGINKLNPIQKGEYFKSNPIDFALIEDVPIFPGCESVNNKKLCFQQKIQEHIRNNFRYPKKAQKKKITGRVTIIFTIDKDGTIANLRTFGAHKILMAESRRIISLLPRMTPGKQKGKLVRVPFAIPLTFALK